VKLVRKSMCAFLLIPMLVAGCSGSGGADNGGPYRLDATITQRAEQYVLDVDTNVKLSADSYAQHHEAGVGHIHYYLNGTLIGPLLNDGPTALAGLPRGENIIKLALAGNDHSEGSYNLVKELTFTVN